MTTALGITGLCLFFLVLGLYWGHSTLKMQLEKSGYLVRKEEEVYVIYVKDKDGTFTPIL